MTAIWAATAQAIMIALAYTAACLAAATFALLPLVQSEGLEALTGNWMRLVESVHLLLVLATVAFMGAFWPALAAVVVSEGFKLRGVTAYLIAGLLVGAGYALGTGDAGSAAGERFLAFSAAAGAVGGFVYWLVAGRTAGRWLELRWFEENRR